MGVMFIGSHFLAVWVGNFSRLTSRSHGLVPIIYSTPAALTLNPLVTGSLILLQEYEVSHGPYIPTKCGIVAEGL